MTGRLHRWWDSLDWFEQIMVAGVLWAIFWVAVIYAGTPYLMEAVT